MTRALLALVAAATLIAGCRAPQPSITSVTSDPVATPDITSPVDGVIVAVDSSGLADVRGFTLRPIDAPFSFRFTLGSLENPAEFPPSHLAEHLVSSEPVRVFFTAENGIHIAYRLEDATER